MPNPFIPQGTISRLAVSILYHDFPSLNVVASYLGKGSLMLSLEGATTQPLPTLTGIVQSPEPYQMARVTIHLVKSTPLANIYKSQIENNAVIGDTTVRTDATSFPPYNLVNCSLSGTEPLNLDGTDPQYTVTLSGIYYINSQLYG